MSLSGSFSLVSPTDPGYIKYIGRVIAYTRLKTTQKSLFEALNRPHRSTKEISLQRLRKKSRSELEKTILFGSRLLEEISSHRLDASGYKTTEQRVIKRSMFSRSGYFSNKYYETDALSGRKTEQGFRPEYYFQMKTVMDYRKSNNNVTKQYTRNLSYLKKINPDILGIRLKFHRSGLHQKYGNACRSDSYISFTGKDIFSYDKLYYQPNNGNIRTCVIDAWDFLLWGENIDGLEYSTNEYHKELKRAYNDFLQFCR